MTVINLTPHDVDICDYNGNIIKTYKASGIVARNARYTECVGNIDGVPLMASRNERMVNLPEPQEDTMYIVSDVVRHVCADRMDIMSPAEKVRINGRVVGCMTFMSNR